MSDGNNPGVHPDAPAGGGGPGRFAVARSPHAYRHTGAGEHTAPHALTARLPRSAARRIKLVLFPGEWTDASGVTRGRIYVAGGKGEIYEAAAGPRPGAGSKGPGGHTAGATPPGKYFLDAAEHHTTINWPMSVIPWGAQLRIAADGEAEYFAGRHWKKATGAHGEVTKAVTLFAQRTTKGALTASDRQRVLDATRKAFFDRTGALRYTTWTLNDFGKWSWNLTKGSRRTAYYIHTTPDDEKATEHHRPFQLQQSHGCVHVRPQDRDQMMARGYLHKGIQVDVRPYGTKGPP